MRISAEELSRGEAAPCNGRVIFVMSSRFLMTLLHSSMGRPAALRTIVYCALFLITHSYRHRRVNALQCLAVGHIGL